MSEQVNVTSQAQEDVLVKHQGPQGEQGLIGPTGPSGSPGGNAGPTGPTGPTGAAGADGDDGAVGGAGAVGNTGPTGGAGADGDDGAAGAAGAVGNTGPTGAAGTDGSNAAWLASTDVPSTAAYNLGDFHLETDTHKVRKKELVNGSAVWVEKADLTGDQGQQGTVGAQGNTGATGQSGALENEGNPKLGGPLDVNGEKIVSASNGNIELEPNGSGEILLDGNVSLGGHMLPTVHATGNSPYPGFDLGSADYKIRHLFLSSNSLWVGDEHKVEVSGGKMKFKKRKKSVIPKAITDSGGNEAGALASSGKGSLTQMTLKDHVSYLTSLDSNKVDVSDLYPPEEVNGSANAAYSNDDWGEISSQEQPGKHPAPIVDATDNVNAELFKAKSFVVTNPTGDLTVNAIGAQPAENVTVEFTIYIKQGATPRTIAALKIDGVPATQLRITGQTPVANEINTFDIKAVFLGGTWKATAIVG